MKSSTAARPFMADYPVAPDLDMPAANSSAGGQDTQQSVQDLRAELLAMVPQLRAFARMLSNDKDSAEELSLTTLAEAWRNRLVLGPETNLKVWLLTIARTRFYSNCHREWRDASLEHAAAKSHPGRGVEQIRSADVPVTMRALRLLPDRFREALILVSASGCSYVEAARICDCPVGTVKSRVYRARQALVAILDTVSFI
jgi:RNA polymerase sigma-70 factor (ECF subfamily)